VLDHLASLGLARERTHASEQTPTSGILLYAALSILHQNRKAAAKRMTVGWILCH